MSNLIDFGGAKIDKKFNRGVKFYAVNFVETKRNDCRYKCVFSLLLFCAVLVMKWLFLLLNDFSYIC